MIAIARFNFMQCPARIMFAFILQSPSNRRASRAAASDEGAKMSCELQMDRARSPEWEAIPLISRADTPGLEIFQKHVRCMQPVRHSKPTVVTSSEARGLNRELRDDRPAPP
jgi:hypothetical protein